MVRLAFSVAIQVDAEILLIDEVLAVGDAALPAEVLRRVPAAQAGGPHDPVRHPRHGLDRALLRPRDAAREGHGWSRSASRPTIARRYNELNFGQHRPRAEQRRGRATLARSADRAAEIVDAWFEDADGRADRRARARRPVLACMEVRFNEPLEDPIFGVTLRNEVGRDRVRDHDRASAMGRPVTSDLVRRWSCGCDSRTGSTPSRYTLTPSVARATAGRRRARPARGHRVARRSTAARSRAASSHLPHDLRDRHGR